MHFDPLFICQNADLSPDFLFLHFLCFHSLSRASFPFFERVGNVIIRCAFSVRKCADTGVRVGLPERRECICWWPRLCAEEWVCWAPSAEPTERSRWTGRWSAPTLGCPPHSRESHSSGNLWTEKTQSFWPLKGFNWKSCCWENISLLRYLKNNTGSCRRKLC